MKLKKNQQVSARGARGVTRVGTIKQVRDTGQGRGRGVWVDVNVGAKGSPLIKSYRPAAVSAI